MKKILIVIGILVLIAAIIFVIRTYFFQSSSISEQPAQNVPNVSTLPPPQILQEQGKIAIPTNKGGVAINDPYKASLKTVAGNAELKSTSNYEITYLGNQKSFVITLYGNNLTQSREEAEQALLGSLGIDQSQICQLTVTVAVSKDANPDAAGKNYGISFCPGSSSLPN